MSLRQVRELVKQNNLRGLSHLNLKELKEVLTEKGIEIPETEARAKRQSKTLVSQSTETEEVSDVEESREVESKTDEKVVEVKAPDYSRLKTIRNKPRRVKITDVETNEEKEFQSMFAAGKFLGHSSKIITDKNGKVYGKYKIEILTPSDNVDKQSDAVVTDV